ncbi:BREX-1 system adenine-specific DNA-methyltransferase PglX [Cryobacterium sp. TmT2-59]|uniref:BREX-1 system adenine-specific DNA-methyltransferase PglX n=1 Tax=Cryobacterium sp. TmT2-59 TaxID=1259264 RepID=UPI001069C8C2|nr:BREX-1 system adenine-specific DNA-methyltransferase PglX [Cryobacterium sp. TmT2-59]TFC82138.1 BREX-1 system adenine-specific DNA-methyltransferase PglX [Cryobacterium sp. TmT2-59]
METAPLKSFATWARIALIREVNARIVAVLAPASKDRVESASVVAALERDIAAGGGGETGRDAIADKVAYTWFNRIIALRFMDANGYTGTGIASPQRGQNIGQPEVLADAKRGNIDPAVVTNKRTIEEITALLDGTRRSDDPQGEAYALLLTEYCRHWNRSMPFMFEREGDYTELLIPANLLADDSVLARAVTVLTEDVCRDVEVIGWLYQFYISERKDEVFAGFKKNKKAGAAEIPAATQLFTPHWIVRYLVENSLGRLWLLNRPTSRLAEQMEYYIKPVAEETDFLKVSSPEELKIIDPAVGSGHMLTYAFDLIYAIYEEEGYAPGDIPGLILQHNLYGTEIDPRAGALAAFALMMKARERQRTFFSRGIQPNICVLEPIRFTTDELALLVTRRQYSAAEELFWNQFAHADLLGALIQPSPEIAAAIEAHSGDADEGDLISVELHERARRVLRQASYLLSQYSVVVANPPYMGSGSFDPLLRSLLAVRFKVTRSDLYAIFIERSLELLRSGGYLAMVTMQGWMFTTSYEGLRSLILARTSIATLAQFGTRAFESLNGEIVATAGVVLCNRRPVDATAGQYIRLVEGNASAKATGLREQANVSHVLQRLLAGLPSTPIVYWEADLLARLYGAHPPIGDLAPIREGIHTGDNARFLRQWWEAGADRFIRHATKRQDVDSAHARWVPYNKGGTSTRWYGNNTLVLAFDRAARDEMARLSGFVEPSKDLYFQAGGTWSDVGTNGLRVKYYPDGYLFADKGPVVVGGDDNYFLIGAMNSSAFGYVGELLMPTISYKAGTVKKIPLPSAANKGQISEIVSEAIEIAKSAWDSGEVSWDFATLPLFDGLIIGGSRLRDAVPAWLAHTVDRSERLQELEEINNGLFEGWYELSHDAQDRQLNFVPSDVSLDSQESAVEDLISYAVGCMFGRYSLDESGLILANQGGTLQEYLAKVPSPSFMPDEDNVIPIVDGDWFEDDIVARFRQFLRVAFGEEHFEENLRFITETLGVKDLRDYFVKSFYKDHVQRYKKRPIYWLFSSPKGSFSALIYMHRYTPSTVSTVLNEYLREFKSKLEASRQHHVRLAASDGTPREKAAAEKEVDRLRKVLLELDEYEHDVLYPLATQQLAIDLDDGVKANYPKFGAALKKIPGLEASDE